MRKRLKNHREVTHFWANQSQEQGSSGNMFFEGDTIYSYGHHFKIARLVKDHYGRTVALFNNEDYSVSTSKHKSYTYSAASHLKVFTVPNLDGGHLENIRYLLNLIQKQKDHFKRDRSGYKWAIDNVRGDVEKVFDYINRFGVKIETFEKDDKKTLLFLARHKKQPFTKSELEELKKYKVRNEKYKTRVLEKERAQAEQWKRDALKRQEEVKKNRQAWLDGKDVYYSSIWNGTVELRVKGDRIQTSQGAEISVKMALKLWDRIKTHQSVEGFDFGPYKADGIKDNVLTVGCHNIPLSEIERIAGIIGNNS